VKLAFGLKAHSGWAALVALGEDRGALQVVERARIELVEKGNEGWAKQPYHAAEEMDPPEARELVGRAVASARGIAARGMRAAVQRATAAGHKVVACAVLVGDGMPDWTVDQILAVHFRMHKAEGELFRDVLVRAARTCQLDLVAIPEKRLLEHAERALKTPAARLTKTVATLGKSIGPPWGKDQKDASLAAWAGLGARTR
jgi:hypothetical protein